MKTVKKNMNVGFECQFKLDNYLNIGSPHALHKNHHDISVTLHK